MPDKISETIQYLRKQREHALTELDDERRKQDWRMVIQVANELRMIEKLIQTLEYLQAQ